MQSYFFKKAGIRSHYQEGMQSAGKISVVDGIRQAINAKHQLIDVNIFSKSQGCRCCKCGKPQTYIGCKSMLFGPNFMMPCCTPQCGGEECRLKCQADADDVMKGLSSAFAAAQGQASQDPLRAQFASKIASSLENLGRICEACSKMDDPDPNGFKNKTCSRCKLAFYCSPECQTKHWKVHKKGCKKAQKRA